MKISPINNSIKHFNFSKPTFKGYTVEDRAEYGYPQTHLRAAEYTNRRSEKTLGSYHADPKNKIYYADPLEKITDKIRESVDYIFYDDEPGFPKIEGEVSRAYFEDAKPYGGIDSYDYKKPIDDYRKYFYRMEMADRKFAGEYENKVWNNINLDDSREKLAYYKARIADAQYNQETAGNCISMLHEAGSKTRQKNVIGMNIYAIEDSIKDRTKDIEKTNREIVQREELESILKTKIENLQNRSKLYNKLNEQITSNQPKVQKGIEQINKSFQYNKSNLAYYPRYMEELGMQQGTELYEKAGAALTSDVTADNKETELISKKVKDIAHKLKKYNDMYEENSVVLSNLKEYKTKLPQIIKDLETELTTRKADLERIKAELIPYFDKLKNYFNARGLRQVKY